MRDEEAQWRGTRAGASRALGGMAVSAAAGSALYLAFPPVGWWWTAVPALALLVACVDRARAGRALLNTTAFGVAFWAPLIPWVVVSTRTPLAWAALVVSQVLFLWLWSLSVSLMRVWSWARSPVGQALGCALAWTGVEQARSAFPWSGFPWGTVALPQVDSPLGRLAPYGGVALVSFAVMAVAVLVRRAFSLAGAGRERWWWRPAMLAGAAAVCVAPLAIDLPSAQEAGALTVGVVQGNISLPGSRAYSHEGEVTGNHASQTRRMLESAGGGAVDLVVWGEGSADRDPAGSAVVARDLEDVSDEAGAPVLMGYSVLADDDHVWNWLALWYPGSGLDAQSRYAKQVPVPFGEFIPFRPLIASLATEAARQNHDMAAGGEPGLMTARLADGREVPIAVGICFEGAYESVIGEGVALGGQVIITPSNNYLFESSAESAQQAQLLRMRAMEYSRSAVQASTTGVSAVIRPDGSVQAATPVMSAASMVETVPLRTSLTPAARMGALPARAAMALAGALLLASAVRARVARSAGDARAAGDARDEENGDD